MKHDKADYVQLQMKYNEEDSISATTYDTQWSRLFAQYVSTPSSVQWE
jgi:hypothetical protein